MYFRAISYWDYPCFQDFWVVLQYFANFLLSIIPPIFLSMGWRRAVLCSVPSAPAGSLRHDPVESLGVTLLKMKNSNKNQLAVTSVYFCKCVGCGGTRFKSFFELFEIFHFVSSLSPSPLYSFSLLKSSPLILLWKIELLISQLDLVWSK